MIIDKEWKKSKDELPKINKRYLGLCYVDYGSSSWTGIIEVWFKPETGWRRCENRDERPIEVVFWREMIQLPDVKID